MAYMSISSRPGEGSGRGNGKGDRRGKGGRGGRNDRGGRDNRRGRGKSNAPSFRSQASQKEKQEAENPVVAVGQPGTADRQTFREALPQQGPPSNPLPQDPCSKHAMDFDIEAVPIVRLPPQRPAPPNAVAAVPQQPVPSSSVGSQLATTTGPVAPGATVLAASANNPKPKFGRWAMDLKVENSNLIGPVRTGVTTGNVWYYISRNELQKIVRGAQRLDKAINKAKDLGKKSEKVLAADDLKKKVAELKSMADSYQAMVRLVYHSDDEADEI